MTTSGANGLSDGKCRDRTDGATRLGKWRQKRERMIGGRRIDRMYPIRTNRLRILRPKEVLAAEG